MKGDLSCLGCLLTFVFCILFWAGVVGVLLVIFTEVVR